MPSTAWYRVAAGIVAVGVVAAVGWFLFAVTVQTDAVNELVTVPFVPGAPVEVAVAGEHTVFAGPACQGACRPRSASTYRRHIDLGFTGPGGEVVDGGPTADQYYNVGSGREGRAVWAVRFPTAGTYALRISSDAEVPPPQLFLGEGRGLPIRLARGSLWLLGAFASLAAVVVARTFVTRRRAIRRLPPALARHDPGVRRNAGPTPP